MQYIVAGDMALSQRPKGPLAGQIEGFSRWARDQGYARSSRYRQVLLAACFSGWLGQRAIRVRSVAADDVARYLRSRAPY